MKNPVGICVSLFLVASVALAEDKATTVPLTETPAAVQKTVTAQIGDAKVDEIDRSVEGGETIFEVDFTTKANEDQDITVADDGTLLKVGVALADVPAAVQKTIQIEAHGGEVSGIDKDVADTEVSYEVNVTKDGQEKDFSVASNGSLTSMDFALTNVPAVVQTAIRAQAGSDSVESIEEDFDPDGNSFDVETVAGDGNRKEFTVAPDGRLLSVVVTLGQVPPGARKTILEQIGDGKILEIDKSLFERKDKVLPYEVQGRKDGRPFNFSVAPRGRFLGMDE